MGLKYILLGTFDKNAHPTYESLGVKPGDHVCCEDFGPYKHHGIIGEPISFGEHYGEPSFYQVASKGLTQRSIKGFLRGSSSNKSRFHIWKVEHTGADAIKKTPAEIISWLKAHLAENSDGEEIITGADRSKNGNENPYRVFTQNCETVANRALYEENDKTTNSYKYKPYSIQIGKTIGSASGAIIGGSIGAVSGHYIGKYIKDKNGTQNANDEKMVIEKTDDIQKPIVDYPAILGAALGTTIGGIGGYYAGDAVTKYLLRR